MRGQALFLALAAALVWRPAAAGGDRVGECRASFSIGNALKELSSVAGGPGRRPPDDPAVWAVGHYVVYKAFAARKPELCAQLKSFDYKAGFDDATVKGEPWCRGEYAKMVFAREFNDPTPGFAEACRHFIEDISGNEKRSRREVSQACGIIERERRRPAAACEALAAELDIRDEFPECLCTLGALAGKTNSCARHVARTSRHVGPRDEDAYAALSAAYRAKDPALCGQSLMCRQIMGVDVTDEFVSRARDAACGTVAARQP